MTIIDPKKEFFCPAPWNSLYQQGNSASPCHANRNTFNLSPKEYFESDFLRSVKDDFLNGRVPPSCIACYDREKLGIKSTRQSVFRSRINEPLEYSKEDFTLDKQQKIFRLEIRTTNLCNFKCRMCTEESSSEIAREKGLAEPIYYADEKVIKELKEIALDQLKVLCLTGGEPMLIKEYYDFLDLLIEKGFAENIMVEMFTNCSVANPLMFERLKKFKQVRFVMSIDGVGKTAEYQRKGTIWETVEKNILNFVTMPEPFEIFYNTAISTYVLLDASSLAKFLMKLYSLNDKIKTKCYSTIYPSALHFINMDNKSKQKVIEEIDKAVAILTPSNFDVLTKEFLNIKRNLLENEPVDPNLFINYTRILDAVRNEKFEDVFGYKLV